MKKEKKFEKILSTIDTISNSINTFVNKVNTTLGNDINYNDFDILRVNVTLGFCFERRTVSAKNVIFNEPLFFIEMSGAEDTLVERKLYMDLYRPFVKLQKAISQTYILGELMQEENLVLDNSNKEKFEQCLMALTEFDFEKEYEKFESAYKAIKFKIISERDLSHKTACGVEYIIKYKEHRIKIFIDSHSSYSKKWSKNLEQWNEFLYFGKGQDKAYRAFLLKDYFSLIEDFLSEE